MTANSDMAKAIISDEKIRDDEFDVHAFQDILAEMRESEEEEVE